jgi:hypothetical protein
MPRLRHDATAERRRMVGELIGRGMPRETIASIIGITPKTLDKHYHAELARGADIANEQVAGKLFAQCIADKNDMPATTARIFWLKARGKWKDQSIEHTGPDGEGIAGNVTNNTVLYLPDNGRDPVLAPPMKTIEHAPPRLKRLA